jgi:SAM-dependent methyltransferase
VVDESELLQLDQLESTHFWYRDRKIQLSRWLAKNADEGSLVLDLGSATGGNSLHMMNLGLEVVSVEFSDYGVEAQRNKGIEVIQADARSLPFKSNTFDLVICLDVLEHIEEDYLAAKEVQRILKPSGKFLFSVPEDPKLWSEHDLAVNHVRRYSKESLTELVINSELKIINIWSSLILLRPIVEFSRKFSKGSQLKPLNKCINLILLSICRLETALVRHKNKGVTLWIDGVKPTRGLH